MQSISPFRLISARLLGIFLLLLGTGFPVLLIAQCDCRKDIPMSLEQANRSGWPVKSLRIETSGDLKEVTRFQNLERLILAANVTEYSLDFSKIPNLKCLELESPRLKSIPEGVMRLEALFYLRIQADSLPYFPEELFRLPNLRSLTIQALEFDLESAGFVTLRASRVEVMHLEGYMGKAERLGDKLPLGLNKIDIKYGQNLGIGSLINALSKFKNLTHLGLIQCSLVRLPHNLDTLSSLESLDLSGNPDFDPNSLSSFPELCRRLETLSFSNLRLKEHDQAEPLPIALDLPSLRSLSLTYSLYPQLDLRKFSAPRLEELVLVGNNHREVPAGLKKFKELNRLDLNFNQLEEVPKYLKKRDLIYLNLYGNETLTDKQLEKIAYWPIAELMLPDRL